MQAPQPTIDKRATRPPAKPTAQRSGALSIAQMLRLMRVEFDKAQRHKYSIVTMMITVDRLEKSDGAEAGAYRKRVMPGVFTLLKKVTCEMSIQGLGCWTGNRTVAVFPHVAPWNVKSFAEELLSRARSLEVPYFGEAGDHTLSIGVAHNQHSGLTTFDEMLEEAETSLVMAHSAGGDRFQQWKEVETELAALRADARALVESQSELEEHTARQASKPDSTLIQKVHGVFARAGEKTPELLRLEKELVALAHSEIEEQKQQAVQAKVQDHRRQMDQLERRITKLTELLQVTEEELKRVIKMKAIDTGIASIYSTIQGISDGDNHAETKKEMMAEIFKANLEFQRKT